MSVGPSLSERPPQLLQDSTSGPCCCWSQCDGYFQKHSLFFLFSFHNIFFVNPWPRREIGSEFDKNSHRWCCHTFANIRSKPRIVSCLFYLGSVWRGENTNTDTNTQILTKFALSSSFVFVFISSGQVCAQDKYTHTRLGAGTQVRRIFWTLTLSRINIKHQFD